MLPMAVLPAASTRLGPLFCVSAAGAGVDGHHRRPRRAG